MLAVVQRVSFARCVVEDKEVAQIKKGIVALLAIGKKDELKDAIWMARKMVNLRIFEDQNGKMNLSLIDVKGEILVVPQFTLYGDCRKGYRPNFSLVANPEKANELFCKVLSLLEEYPVRVKRGVFGAKMRVEITNEGPVTIIISSDKGKNMG